MEDKVYSMDELAWAFRCSREEAVRLCQAGSIRAFRYRGCYYVREGAIVEYLMRLHRTQERKRAMEHAKRKRPAYVYDGT